MSNSWAEKEIPLQVCYWGGYCDESLNPNSGKENKEKRKRQIQPQ